MADKWEQRYRKFVSQLDRELYEGSLELRSFKQLALAHDYSVRGCGNISDICDKLEMSCPSGCEGVAKIMQRILSDAKLHRYKSDIDNLVAEIGGTSSEEQSLINPENTLNFLRKDRTMTIHWSQGFLSRSQSYDQCTYRHGKTQDILVFVQSNFGIPDHISIGNNLQYGFTEGRKFYVLHDKSQKPYQHRFVEQGNTMPLNLGGPIADLCLHGMRATVGEYLQDV